MIRSRARLLAPLLASAALAACAPRSSIPDGASLLDEEVVLLRGSELDSAQRELALDADSVVIAFVEEENLTDVQVRIEALAAHGAAAPVVVENHLRGAGIEVAALEAARGARIRVTISSVQESTAPGRVHLRLRRFQARSQESAFEAQREAGLAWSAATHADFRADSIKKTGFADMDRAIAGLSGPGGDARLAAEARLVKANLYEYFQIQWAPARDEARRAAAGFAALAPAEPLNAGRARLIEGRALRDMALDFAAVNPSSQEANDAARRIFEDLSGDASPFGTLERARALAELGFLEVREGMSDSARRRFETARTIYLGNGYTAGEREMRYAMAYALVTAGRWGEGAAAFEKLFPEIDRFTEPTIRVSLHILAARAIERGGNTDQTMNLFLKALDEARRYKLRTQEGMALQEMGVVYWNRGDLAQAATMYEQALRICSAESDIAQYADTLSSMGNVTRSAGHLDEAIAMHLEAARRQASPIGRMRSIASAGFDHQLAGRYAEAIALYRRSLAVKLETPNHHAYSDVKRRLAAALIDYGDDSPATLAEAQRLIEEALQRTIEVKDKISEIAAHAVIARLLAKRGKFDASLAEYNRTFTQIVAIRAASSNPALNNSAVSFEEPAFRGYFDLVMRDLARRGPAAPRPATPTEENALRMLELARRSHFGALRAQRAYGTEAVRIDGLLSQMAEKSLRIAQLAGRKLGAAQQAELEALQFDMSKLRTDVDGARIAAARQAGGSAQAGSANRWRALAEGVAQISYGLGNDHAYAWVRSAHGTRVALLAGDSASLERELTELASLDAQGSPEKIELLLRQVSSVLMPPKLVPDDSHALEIVAEGRVASVPFAGLQSPADPTRRLIETHTVRMITSMFDVGEAPRPAHARPFRLVALASGHGTLRSAAVEDPVPRLGAAVAEISSVARLFESQDPSANIKLLTGDEGNAAALQGLWSSGADVVHFATHALADLNQPLASLLVLPASVDGKSTYLTAGQVQGWQGDTDLVFLSACESAVGPPRFAGGMPGMQSAFLRAGARGVIATLWPIEDVLAREFSVDFYRRFTTGASAIQALSETQRQWLTPVAGLSEADQRRRNITALAHAYYSL
jgi:CHAT domain-containing protein/tetratricopeptide (TPR) repeat protein